MNKPAPKYLSKQPLVRYGSVKKLTKRELISLAKKRAVVTYPPEMLPSPDEGDEAEVIVGGRVVYVKTGEPFQ